VLDAWSFEKPSTKSAVAALKSLGVEGRVLVVLGENDEAAWKSLRNLQHIHPILRRELNAYDVLVADWVVFTRETLPSESEAPTPAEVSISTPAEDVPADAPGAPAETASASEPEESDA
jgi:large subunit ribosomal protein L4